MPLRVAVNAQLSPNNYLVAAQGQANGIAFRTVNPARITGAAKGYALAPTRIDFGQGPTAGSARVAGSFGGGVTAANFLGRSVYSADKTFKGRLKDVRLYNRALSGSEVAGLPSNGTPLLLSQPSMPTDSSQKRRSVSSRTAPAVSSFR